MRRALAILLTVMLAVASAGAAHATPHGYGNAHVMAGDAPETAMHAAAPMQAASSCRAGEVQRTGLSWAMFLAVLPADPLASCPALRPPVFAMATGERLDPERLLDPPRS